MGTQLLWLKRDLRLDDHRALAKAAQLGPVVGLFVFEEGLLRHPDTDPSHVQFTIDALTELRARWEERGGLLLVRVGTVVEQLERLHRDLGFADLWSHQETGSRWTYDRDLRVQRWARERGVTWREPWQHGVVRRLRTRDGWAGNWARRMGLPLAPTPRRLDPPEGCALDPGRIPTLAELGLGTSPRVGAQRGGETAARETLSSFLQHRSVDYRAAMASPLEGWDACSRISPHLAFGTLSLRRAVHETAARIEQLRAARAAGEDVPATWLPSLASFQSRLSWHCHFMQRLEDAPDMEDRELNPAYAGMNEGHQDERLLTAYAEGRTGYPMVDASMRCLRATGWLNFRMRAMLVSFGTHHLAQRWQDIGRVLAPLFLDYEPGIHWSQVQMQASVVGINTVRIYSPEKQARDQDPEGTFVQRWVPELEGVPPEHLPAPHATPPLLLAALGLGDLESRYPRPLVDSREAVRAARERIAAVRGQEGTRHASREVHRKHGSRKAPRRRAHR